MIITEAANTKSYKRIISLVPSQTELLAYLDLKTEVIGITKFCIHPEKWFREKTKIGGTKNIHVQKIRQLSPDLIIANKEENVKEQIEQLATEYDVWVTDVNNLAGGLKMISDIGVLTGKSEIAEQLIIKISDGFNHLKKISSTKMHFRTAYLIWKNPYIVAAGDTFINDMMQYAGFKNIFSKQKRYPKITLNEIKEKNAELILLSSEPYPFKEKDKEEIEKQLSGIEIRLVDGEMFSWYGNRLLRSINYFQLLLQHNS